MLQEIIQKKPRSQDAVLILSLWLQETSRRRPWNAVVNLCSGLFPAHMRENRSRVRALKNFWKQYYF